MADIEKPKRFRRKKMCKCEKNLSLPAHTCPYQEDINHDHETLCNCCDECWDNCVDDI